MMMMMKNLLFKIIHKTIDFYWEYQYSIYCKNYSIPPSFRFNGRGIKIYGKGTLEIKQNSYLGNSSQIQVSKDYKVVIGDNCRLASGIKIYTGTNLTDQDFGGKELKKVYGNVIIEDNVWIGANVFIVPGVKIGENSVIGANSVVTKDILPWTINGGVPAKLIKEKSFR